MVTKERADPLWPPSLPSLSNGIALLVQLISATSAGLRSLERRLGRPGRAASPSGSCCREAAVCWLHARGERQSWPFGVWFQPGQRQSRSRVKSPGKVTCPRGCTGGTVAENGPHPGMILLCLHPGYPSHFSPRMPSSLRICRAKEII